MINELAIQLKANNYSLSTAESCTAGQIAKQCTDIAGSSDWFYGGFVTYANKAKSQMLNVPEYLLRNFGAVSVQVAKAMVQGCAKATKTNIVIAVTGIAGPGGGSEMKPVGLVYFAIKINTEIYTFKQKFIGSRKNIRNQATQFTIIKTTQLIKRG